MRANGWDSSSVLRRTGSSASASEADAEDDTPLELDEKMIVWERHNIGFLHFEFPPHPTHPKFPPNSKTKKEKNIAEEKRKPKPQTIASAFPRPHFVSNVSICHHQDFARNTFELCPANTAILNHMQKFHIFLANTLFVTHCLFAIFILSGWIFPEIKALYLAVLLIWISCWIFLGYCPPTKWEFLLRKKYNDSIDPNTEFIQYYAYAFFKKRISSRTVFISGIIVCTILLLLAFYVN